MTDLSPAAAFLSDLLTAVQRAKEAGCSAKRMAKIANDLADDLRDLADDNQWPNDPPVTLAAAQEQIDKRKP